MAADALGRVAAPIARRAQRVDVNCMFVGGGTVVVEDMLGSCCVENRSKVGCRRCALSFAGPLSEAIQWNPRQWLGSIGHY